MKSPVLRVWRVALALMLSVGLFSCARLKVESDPTDARVMWSPSGTADWRPWPPRGLDTMSGTENPATPMTSYGRYNNSFWITVEKDGYFRPLPQVAQLYSFRRQKLHFTLLETPETTSARMRAEGFVFFDGDWVKPEEMDLAQFEGVWMRREEAFEKEQLAAGLVPYEGEWLTSEEYATRFEADQRARGFVPFKNRWMTTEEMESEQRIDAEVAELEAMNLRYLDSPKVIGRVDSRDARVQLFNTTSRAIRFLISGPMSREFTLDSYESYGVTPATRLFFPPGRYTVAVVPMESSAIDSLATEGIGREVLDDTRADYPTMLLETPLAMGFHYLFGYTGGADVSLDDEQQYQLETPELPPNLPTIEIPDVRLPEPRRPQGGPPGGPRQGGPGMPGGGRQGGGPPGGGAPGGGRGGAAPERPAATP
jgi:hypothetical protein